MRVIPVLDLKAGRAVHAVAGDRAHYGPVRSVLHEGPDPIDLARVYRDVLGLRELYLADLDAIAGAPPALPVVRALSDLGMSLYLDAGVRDRATLGPLLGSGAAGLVLGLETVRGPSALAEAVALAGPERLVFSLDVREGRPVVAPGSDWGTDDPHALAGLAFAAGLRRLLLLDLARVGTGSGVGGLGLAARLAARHPEIEVWVGGGIAGAGEFPALAEAGAAVVLVGSALLDGRIGKTELDALSSAGGKEIRPPGHLFQG